VSANRFWGSARRKVVHGPKRKVWQGQGWQPLYGAIAAWFFREYDPPPSEQRFAQLVAGWQREQEGLAVNGILSKTPWQKMLEQATQGLPPSYTSPIDGLVRPGGWEQIANTFGDPRAVSQTTWETQFIGAARAPGSLRFNLGNGQSATSLRLHRRLVPHAEAFFSAVARGGLWDELQPMGPAYAWDPGGQSLHTWGIALDLRPSQYQRLEDQRDYPGPGAYPPGYLVRHIQAFGWQWGLWFDPPRPGHLQFATGVAGC
jgi:hypothetical protein